MGVGTVRRYRGRGFGTERLCQRELNRYPRPPNPVGCAQDRLPPQSGKEKKRGLYACAFPSVSRGYLIKHNTLQAVLFDLDGTLVDTAPDLAAALNAVRAEYGHGPLPFPQIRTQVSHGATALTRLGFPDLAEDSAEFQTRRERLLHHYAAKLAVHSRVFSGITQLIDFIEDNGIAWGVVTNKPAYLTLPLLTTLGLRERAACIVSGDSTPQRKPHPLPLLHACELIGTSPRACVYVGDAERDIEAGRGAGMVTLVALFGYLSLQDRPETWGADDLVQDPAEITAWIAARMSPSWLLVADGCR